MQLLDEQDHRPSRLRRLLQQRLEPVLELALRAGPGQQCADVEAQQSRMAQLRRDLGLGDRQREPLDDRGLAYAGLAGEQRVVLAPTQQDVHHGSDLLTTADDGIDPLGTRMLGEIGAVGGQRGAGRGDCCHRETGFAGKHRHGVRAIARSFRFFG